MYRPQYSKESMAENSRLCASEAPLGGRELAKSSRGSLSGSASDAARAQSGAGAQQGLGGGPSATGVEASCSRGRRQSYAERLKRVTTADAPATQRRG